MISGNRLVDVIHIVLQWRISPWLFYYHFQTAIIGLLKKWPQEDIILYLLLVWIRCIRITVYLYNLFITGILIIMRYRHVIFSASINIFPCQEGPYFLP